MLQNNTIKYSHIYIDASNIILSARNINLDLSIQKLIVYLVDRYSPEKIVFFIGNFSKHKNLFLDLESLGVEIVLKHLYNENKKLKANCDVEISHRITYVKYLKT